MALKIVLQHAGNYKYLIGHDNLETLLRPFLTKRFARYVYAACVLNSGACSEVPKEYPAW